MSNNGGMTLTEFLEARIAEDEAAAQSASPGPWQWVGEPAEDSAFLYTENGDAVISAYGMHTEGYIECSDADRAYIARNNPSRVLAECAAKRAIIEQHQTYVKAAAESVGIAFIGARGGQEVTGDVLKVFASVYRGHPDYQQEWSV